MRDIYDIFTNNSHFISLSLQLTMSSLMCSELMSLSLPLGWNGLQKLLHNTYGLYSRFHRQTGCCDCSSRDSVSNYMKLINENSIIAPLFSLRRGESALILTHYEQEIHNAINIHVYHSGTGKLVHSGIN